MESNIVWTKSRRSNPSGNCVECAARGGNTLIRDSKVGDEGGILCVDEQSWQAVLFTYGAR